MTPNELKPGAPVWALTEHGNYVAAAIDSAPHGNYVAAVHINPPLRHYIYRITDLEPRDPSKQGRDKPPSERQRRKHPRRATR